MAFWQNFDQTFIIPNTDTRRKHCEALRISAITLRLSEADEAWKPISGNTSTHEAACSAGEMAVEVDQARYLAELVAAVTCETAPPTTKPHGLASYKVNLTDYMPPPKAAVARLLHPAADIATAATACHK